MNGSLYISISLFCFIHLDFFFKLSSLLGSRWIHGVFAFYGIGLGIVNKRYTHNTERETQQSILHFLDVDQGRTFRWGNASISQVRERTQCICCLKEKEKEKEKGSGCDYYNCPPQLSDTLDRRKSQEIFPSKIFVRFGLVEGIPFLHLPTLLALLLGLVFFVE